MASSGFDSFGDAIEHLPADPNIPVTLVAVTADIELLTGVTDTVRSHGHEAVGTRDLSTGLKLIWRLQPRFALLDIEMLTDQEPEGPVCRSLREYSQRLIVTLRCEDRRGIEMLANQPVAEILFKPFEVEELWLRITRLIKRIEAGAPSAPSIAAGDAREQRPRVGCWAVDVASRTLTCADTGRKRQLTQTELNAVLTLHEAGGATVTRDTLSQAIFGSEWDPRSRRLDALMSRLRRKLECDRHGESHAVIRTDFGRGYWVDT